MRTILDTTEHKIQVGDTSPEAELWAKGLREKEWVDSELARTDRFVTVPDHPERQSYLQYRVELYNYSTTVDGERPTK